MKNVRDEARKLQAGWRKYVEIFGEVPHGTENQLAALLTFAKLDDYKPTTERPTKPVEPVTTHSNPLIQIGKDHAVRLSELEADESYGAHSDWAGQQAQRSGRQGRSSEISV